MTTRWVNSKLLSLHLDDELLDSIELHEGNEKSAYIDSLGYWTIGVGRLIDKRKNAGLSQDECQYLFANDLIDRISSLRGCMWYMMQNNVRRGVLIEMAFALGFAGLCNFHRMIEALKIYDFEKASLEIADSKWARTVGSARVKNLQYRMLTGNYPDETKP